MSADTQEDRVINLSAEDLLSNAHMLSSLFLFNLMQSGINWDEKNSYPHLDYSAQTQVHEYTQIRQNVLAQKKDQGGDVQKNRLKRTHQQHTIEIEGVESSDSPKIQKKKDEQFVKSSLIIPENQKQGTAQGQKQKPERRTNATKQSKKQNGNGIASNGIDNHQQDSAQSKSPFTVFQQGIQNMKSHFDSTVANELLKQSKKNRIDSYPEAMPSTMAKGYDTDQRAANLKQYQQPYPYQQQQQQIQPQQPHQQQHPSRVFYNNMQQQPLQISSDQESQMPVQLKYQQQPTQYPPHQQLRAPPIQQPQLQGAANAAPIQYPQQVNVPYQRPPPQQGLPPVAQPNQPMQHMPAQHLQAQSMQMVPNLQQPLQRTQAIKQPIPIKPQQPPNGQVPPLAHAPQPMMMMPPPPPPPPPPQQQQQQDQQYHQHQQYQMQQQQMRMQHHQPYMMPYGNPYMQQQMQQPQLGAPMQQLENSIYVGNEKEIQYILQFYCDQHNRYIQSDKIVYDLLMQYYKNDLQSVQQFKKRVSALMMNSREQYDKFWRPINEDSDEQKEFKQLYLKFCQIYYMSQNPLHNIPLNLHYYAVLELDWIKKRLQLAEEEWRSKSMPLMQTPIPQNQGQWNDNQYYYSYPHQFPFPSQNNTNM